MKTDLQIAHLSSVHASTDVRIYAKECQSLSKAGYRVHLVVSNDLKVPELSAVNTVFVKKRHGRLQRMIFTAWDVLRASLALDADAYHFHDPELIPVGLFLKTRGKIVVYDIHEDLPRQVMNKTWIIKPLRVFISALMEKVEKVAVWFFDGVVAATPRIAGRFPENKSITVFNYPILKESSNKDEVFDYQQRPNNLVYAGGISATRGVQQIVAALSVIPGRHHARLQLTGKFVDDNCYQDAINLPEWRQVVFHGMVTHNEVYNVYNQSRVGLVLLHPTPSFVASYPVKLFEYMSAGLPIVASDFPLWRQIIEDAECGMLVDPLNLDQVAEAITYLLDNPQQAEEMGRNGYKAVCTKYNWQSEFDKLNDFYAQLFKSYTNY